MSHETSMMLGSFGILGPDISGIGVENVDKDADTKFARAVQTARCDLVA